MTLGRTLSLVVSICCTASTRTCAVARVLLNLFGVVQSREPRKNPLVQRFLLKTHIRGDIGSIHTVSGSMVITSCILVMDSICNSFGVRLYRICNALSHFPVRDNMLNALEVLFKKR